MIDKERTLKKRFWLLSNFDWLLSEVAYHRDMKRFFSDKKYIIWTKGSDEGKVVINEITDRSDKKDSAI